MLEYPELSLDRFDGANLNASMYFLSHCHSDHMVGLDSPILEEHLRSSPQTRIICHEITAGLLRGSQRYKHLSDFLDVLSIDTAHLMEIPPVGLSSDSTNAYMINVTLVPAGHCPGSVMFVIDGKTGRVIYTGDFRFDIGDVRKISVLFDDRESLRLPIESVYVDTTFCTKEAYRIPSRQICFDAIIKVISEWTSCQGRAVHVQTNYDYGYEFLIMTISRYFDTKIHVSEFQYNRYRLVETIKRCLTLNSRETFIHFCRDVSHTFKNANQISCLHEKEVLNIIPSVMYFARAYDPSQLMKKDKRGLRLCYSTHSSYEEVVDFLKALSPRNIYPNVIPNGKGSLHEVRDDLKFLQQSDISFPVTGTISFRKRKNVHHVPEIPEATPKK